METFTVLTDQVLTLERLAETCNKAIGILSEQIAKEFSEYQVGDKIRITYPKGTIVNLVILEPGKLDRDVHYGRCISYLATVLTQSGDANKQRHPCKVYSTRLAECKIERL
jgi:hypothetical protein